MKKIGYLVYIQALKMDIKYKYRQRSQKEIFGFFFICKIFHSQHSIKKKKL